MDLVNPRLLATYLNDHLAASTGAVELSRRSASSNRGNAYGGALQELAAEIEEDRGTLLAIMRRLDIREDRAKCALVWGAEKLGRLKPNGRLIEYSPLSRLEEVEILELGVQGKLLLWEALRHAQHAPVSELERLVERAESQRHRLEALRRDAAAEALSEG